jgi:hypothetical protein
MQFLVAESKKKLTDRRSRTTAPVFISVVFFGCNDDSKQEMRLDH